MRNNGCRGEPEARPPKRYLKGVRKKGLLFGVLVMAIVLSGCAGIKKRSLRADYMKELSRWTASVSVYGGLEKRLDITATYKAPAFRQAYADYYGESYGLDTASLANLRKKEADAAERYNEFLITVQSSEEKWISFTGKNPVWRLYLADDRGSTLTPLSIRKVDASDPLVRAFFPYTDLWSTVYLVRFPKYTPSGTKPVPGPDTERLTLVVTGVLGRATLEWELK